MTILRNTAKSACLMVFILAAAVVVILIIGFVLLSGGIKLGESGKQSTASPYIQDIVPAEQEPASWYLSPAGNKLLYDTTPNQDQAIIRFLATDKEVTIAGCSRFSWLNNNSIYCYDFYDDNYEPFIIPVDISSNSGDSQKLFITELSAEQVELDRLLKQAKVIYRLHPLTEPDSLLILDAAMANQNHHVTGIENLNQVLSL